MNEKTFNEFIVLLTTHIETSLRLQELHKRLNTTRDMVITDYQSYLQRDRLWSELADEIEECNKIIESIMHELKSTKENYAGIYEINGKRIKIVQSGRDILIGY